jgi:hypothetical protein
LSQLYVGLTPPAHSVCSRSSLHDELRAASKSMSLAALTAAAAGQALGVLSRRAAALMAPPSELRSVSGPASGAHLRNIALCSQLHEVHRSLLMLLPKLTPSAAEVRSPPVVPNALQCWQCFQNLWRLLDLMQHSQQLQHSSHSSPYCCVAEISLDHQNATATMIFFLCIPSS